VIDLSLLILSIGISSSLLFFSLSYMFKVFNESKIKKGTQQKQNANHHQHHEQDKLVQQLEKYQSEIFGRSLVHPSERTRMIAARIREESKTGAKNASSER